MATPGAGYYLVNWTGNVSTIADVYAAATAITTNGDYSFTANFGVAPVVSAGNHHAVELKSDDNVVAVGSDQEG